MSSKIQNRAAFTMAAFLFTIAALLLTACGGGGGSAGGGNASLNLNAAIENAARDNPQAESEIRRKTSGAANASPRSGSVTQSQLRNRVGNPVEDIVNITVNRSSGVNYEIHNSSNIHGWSVTMAGDTRTIPGWRGFVNSRSITVAGTPGILIIHAESNYENAADTDYLAGGLWMFAPSVVPGDPGRIGDLQVGAFADGSDPFNEANIVALTGNAVYNGDAIGLYSESLPNGDIAFDGGEFSGKVSLLANFDDDTISGRVHNIIVTRNGSGNNVGRIINGAIVLDSTRISDGLGGGDSGFFTGNTRVEIAPSSTGVFSSGIDLGGAWGGQFYGNNACANIPGSVAGTFGGEFRGGVNGFTGTYEYDFIGAFGASAASCR